MFRRPPETPFPRVSAEDRPKTLLCSGYRSDDNEYKRGQDRNQADDKVNLRAAGTEFLDVRVLRLLRIIADQIFLLLIGRERPELVIFDPVQALFPPGISMTSRQQSRETLDILVQLAQEYNTAFLLVCHTNKKKTDDWRQRITGSADLPDIARSVIFTSYTDLRMGKKLGCRIRYLSNEKNSYAKQEMTVLYTIDGDGIVSFIGISEKRFADYVSEERKRKAIVPGSRSQKEICRSLILQMLAGVEKMPMKELNDALSSAGIGRKAMDQAKAELEQQGIVVRWNEPEGKRPCWYIRHTA